MPPRPKREGEECRPAQMWAETQRPTSLDACDLHPGVASQLRHIAEWNPDAFPHLMLHGPPGAGKKTLARAVIAHLFRSPHLFERADSEARSMRVLNGKPVDRGGEVLEFDCVSTFHHIEVRPSSLGALDKSLIGALLEACKQAFSAASVRQQGAEAEYIPQFQVLVVEDAERLSPECQAAMRRFMERYMTWCRFILLTSEPAAVIDPIRSRCECIRVPAPTLDAITALVQNAPPDGPLPREEAEALAQLSDQDAYAAMLFAESHARLGTVWMPAWWTACDEIAGHIVEEQTPGRLARVRQKVYDVLERGALPSDVFWRLLRALLANAIVAEAVAPSYLIREAARYDTRNAITGRSVMHIEAFCGKAMLAIGRGFAKEKEEKDEEDEDEATDWVDLIACRE